MRKLNIALGNSSKAKVWSNGIITFDELCEKLKTTLRTPETVEEYPKLKKEDRDKAKDKGGFVGGLLRDNRRTRETVVSRSTLTLDADRAEVGFIERFIKECKYAACLYTTHVLMSIELDAIYFPINLKGTKKDKMPRYKKNRTSSAFRGISRYKVCVMTASDSQDNMLFEISGLGSETTEMLMKLKERFQDGSILVTK